MYAILSASSTCTGEVRAGYVGVAGGPTTVSFFPQPASTAPQRVIAKRSANGDWSPGALTRELAMPTDVFLAAGQLAKRSTRLSSYMKLTV
jgi:hypothetical protein